MTPEHSPDEPLIGLQEAAEDLGISKSTLDRWHYLGWAACTKYVTVGVPGVGSVEAKRWSETDVQRIKADLTALKELDSERAAAVRAATTFGRALARARLHRVSAPLLDGQPIPSAFANLTDNNLGYRVGVKSAVTSLLKVQHEWACLLLEKRLALGGQFHSKCNMEIDWKQYSFGRDGARGYWLSHSFGGLRGGRPWYEIRVNSYLPCDCTVSDLAKTDAIGVSEEYPFIRKDREIGELRSLSPQENLLRVQLHEIAHAADAWAKSQKHPLPTEMLEEETALRTDLKNGGGKASEAHGPHWSAIYRFLRRNAGLVRVVRSKSR